MHAHRTCARASLTTTHRYAPKRFFDLYPAEGGNTSVPRLAPHSTLSTNVPAVALQNWQILEFCQCKDMNCGPLSKAYPLDNTTVAPDAAACVNVSLLANGGAATR